MRASFFEGRAPPTAKACLLDFAHRRNVWNKNYTIGWSCDIGSAFRIKPAETFCHLTHYFTFSTVSNTTTLRRIHNRSIQSITRLLDYEEYNDNQYQYHEPTKIHWFWNCKHSVTNIPVESEKGCNHSRRWLDFLCHVSA